MLRLVELAFEVVELALQERARVLDRLVVDRRAELLHEEVEHARRGELADLEIERLGEEALRAAQHALAALLGETDAHRVGHAGPPPGAKHTTLIATAGWRASRLR